MHRRSWLGLGTVAGVALAAGAGAFGFFSPRGIETGKLPASSRRVFAGVARGLLHGTLPADAAATDGLLERIDRLVSALPPHAQEELSQLLQLLAAPAGRSIFAGLHTDWEQASVADIQESLESMRVSRLAVRRQAYQALHDIVGAAYFSDAGTWPILGYPGPVAL